MDVGVLTVSDRCSRGEAEDLSGPALVKIVRGRSWKVRVQGVVPDGLREIRGTLRDWCDELGLPLVLTTGGTGLGPRDMTPEATRPLLDKELPGFGELMRREGLKATPLAVLSRSLAGVRGKSLILNLPGSPKGAAESLRAVLAVIPHAVAIVRGEHAH